MRTILFLIFLFSCISQIVLAFRDPKKFYEYPCLIALVTLVFIMPTLIFTYFNADILSDTLYNRYVLNAILCFWFGIIGYRFALKNFKIKSPIKNYVYDKNAMVRILTFYVLIGGIMSSLIDATKFGNETTGGQFSIILYFARLLRPAAVILISIYLIRPSKFILLLIGVWFFFSLKFMIISGRRSEFFTLGMIIFFPLYFFKKVVIPRYVIVIGLILGVSAITLFPVFRQFTKAGNYTQITNVSVVQAIRATISGTRTNEVIEACYNMNVVATENSYNYGVTFINDLTFQYVSSTLFGEETKREFQLPSVDLEALRKKNHTGYSDTGFKYYLTLTGYASAFIEFGYLGCLLFLIFGFISGVIFKNASFRKTLTSKVFYCMFAVMILFSVYDTIPSVLTYFIPYLLVFIHTFYFSRRKILSQ